MSLVLTPESALEVIERKALVVLFDNLNDELARQEAAWLTADEEFYTLLGRTPVAITLEPIKPENFYTGHRPSLIEDDEPIEHYPNVSVMSDLAQPVAGGNLDHGSELNNSFYIEAIIKSESEDQINSRCKRTGEAIRLTLMKNKTLSGLVEEINEPTVRISNVWTRRSGRGHGAKLFFQMARLEYTVPKTGPYPGNSTQLMGAEIDQA